MTLSGGGSDAGVPLDETAAVVVFVALAETRAVVLRTIKGGGSLDDPTVLDGVVVVGGFAAEFKMPTLDIAALMAPRRSILGCWADRTRRRS